MKYGEVYGDWHGGGGGSVHTCDWGTEDDVIIVQVHRGTPGYNDVHRGTLGYTGVHRGTQGYTRVHRGTQGYTRVIKGNQG